jgi:hypothetical protein
MFVMMCSNDTAERAKFMQHGWLRWVPKANVVMLCGAKIEGINNTDIPPLPIDSYIKQRFPELSNYQLANLRHLRGTWWLGTKEAARLDTNGIQWVMLIDDDTFVNVPLLLSFLNDVPPTLPVLFAHLYERINVPGKKHTTYKNLTFPQGGAGMLFSSVALKQMASVLFTERCELRFPVNDATIGACSPSANVTKIHTTKFGTQYPTVDVLRTLPSRLDAGMLVTVHRCKTFEQMLEYTCTVAARFGWPHPECSGRAVECGTACHVQ